MAVEVLGEAVVGVTSSNSKGMTQQLPAETSIGRTLAAATCTLLGTVHSPVVIAEEDPSWEFNTALLYYGENDDRVQDYSFNLLVRKNFVDDRQLTFGVAVDTLTGATPIGAIPAAVPQTFTSPSALAVNAVPANEIPLDDTFLDTRYALNVGWLQPIGRLSRFSAGITASTEHDYLHLGANLSVARDFNKRNTTLSFAAAFSSDDIDPEGGAPIPLSPMSDLGDIGNRRGEQSKEVLDLVFGVTQVVSKNVLLQFNYSLSDSSGYLNDPYKIVSLVDSVTGEPVPRTTLPGIPGPVFEYRFESRPDSRTKHSVFAQSKLYRDGKVLDASYRYMTDDWEIESHTVEVRYRWPIGNSGYLEPHLRFYSQTAAEFYRAGISNTAAGPTFASADYRLGEFDAYTVGLKYGWLTSTGNEWSARLELYSADGSVPAELLLGDQTGEALYPDLDAIIFQIGYRFGR